MSSFTEVGLIATIKGLGTFNAGTAMMRKQMGITGSSARSFSSGFNNSMTGLGQSVLNAGRTVRAFGNELTFLGFQLTFLASGAFAAITAKGVEFESTIVRMSTLATVATEDLGELASAAQSLGPALGQGPTELADAMFDIVSSGFSAAEALEIIQSTAKGASIGLGDVRTVTDAVTSAMRAFSDENLSASRATDILVQAVREGKGEVDALAGTIGRVLGIASQLGVTFEETAAFISTFTRVGVPAEVAVTSLRSALTNILKPTQAARDALEKYGLTMDDIKRIIDEKGLAQALITLSTILGDDDEAFGRVIGSARGLAGVLINTGPLLEDYKQVLASISEEANQTNEAFALFAQTTEFKLAAAKAAFESLFITMSNTLKPIINLILDQVPKIAGAFEEIIQKRPGLFLLVGVFSAIVAAIGPLAIVAGLTITSLGTLISVFGALAVAIGSVLSPIGLVIGGLAALAATITGLFIASFQKTRQKLADQGRAISFDAYAWGRNIVVQFARGMAAAITYVFQVLTAIAKAISNLLKPGSPPKILPDLDKWGKGAMEAYMEGWLSADFSIFQSIADKIEGFLRSLDLPEIDIVPTILGIRKQLAKLIDQFTETGRVSAETIAAIAGGFGEAGVVVEQYIRAMLRLAAANKAVEDAQNNLNEVQEKYRKLLEPINKELDAIGRRRQEVIDQQREAELRAILNDENAPALAKELALMELREIALKRQQRAIEDQRDADESAAQERLDAAQEEQDAAQARVDALEQFISVQEKNNQLIQEQIELLKRLADAMSDLGGGGGVGDIEEPDLGDLGVGDIPTGGFELPDDVEGVWTDPDMDLGMQDITQDTGLGTLEGLFGDIDTAAQGLADSMAGIGAEIAEAWKPAIKAGEAMTDAWSDVFSADLGNLEGSPLGNFFDTIQEIIDNSNIGEFINNFKPIAQTLERIGQVAPFVLIAAGAVKAFFEAFVSAFEELGDEDGSGVASSLESIREAVEGFDTLPELFDTFILDPLAAVVVAVSSVVAGIAAFGTVILTAIPAAAESFKTKVEEMNKALDKFVTDTLGSIGQWVVDFLGSIFGGSDKAEKRLGRMSKDGSGFIEDLKDNAIKFVKDMFAKIPTVLSDLFDSVVGPEGWLTKIYNDGKKLWEDLKAAAITAIDNIQPEVDVIFQTFIQWVGEQVGLFVSVGTDIGAGLLQGIMDALGPLIAFIEELINSLIEAANQESESSSPSKRMIEVGNNLMDGLMVGMASKAAAVEDTMRSIVRDSIAGASEEELAIAMAAKGGMGTALGRGYGEVAGPTATNPGYYNYSNRESSFGPINIYGGLDVAALKALIRQEVNNAI